MLTVIKLGSKYCNKQVVYTSHQSDLVQKLHHVNCEKNDVDNTHGDRVGLIVLCIEKAVVNEIMLVGIFCFGTKTNNPLTGLR